MDLRVQPGFLLAPESTFDLTLTEKKILMIQNYNLCLENMYGKESVFKNKTDFFEMENNNIIFFVFLPSVIPLLKANVTRDKWNI